MGMDYMYAGSASYPRFDRELCAVAKVFGGVETEYLRELKEDEIEGSIGYWFGFMSSDYSGEAKFVFPEGTNETLIKWFNDIYGEFTFEETMEIWKCVIEHEEIQEISHQIWYELEVCVRNGDAWSIFE